MYVKLKDLWTATVALITGVVNTVINVLVELFDDDNQPPTQMKKYATY